MLDVQLFFLERNLYEIMCSSRLMELVNLGCGLLCALLSCLFVFYCFERLHSSCNFSSSSERFSHLALFDVEKIFCIFIIKKCRKYCCDMFDLYFFIWIPSSFSIRNVCFFFFFAIIYIIIHILYCNLRNKYVDLLKFGKAISQMFTNLFVDIIDSPTDYLQKKSLLVIFSKYNFLSQCDTKILKNKKIKIIFQYCTCKIHN